MSLVPSADLGDFQYKVPRSQVDRVRLRRRAGSLDRGPQSPQFARRGRGKAASDWRRAVAVVSERRVAQGRALYTERSPAELYRGARSSERERYARQASRLGAERPFPAPACEMRILATPHLGLEAGRSHVARGWISARTSPTGRGVGRLGRHEAAQSPSLGAGTDLTVSGAGYRYLQAIMGIRSLRSHRSQPGRYPDR